MEDRIFGDDDTNTALAAPALTQAAASLIRRGFPARLFVDDTRGGAPLFGGHIGFGCKPVMSAAKDFGLAEGDLAALLKEGQIIAITANAARFRLAKTHSLAALAPTLDKMTDRLTALLGHASREAAEATPVEPKARPRLASPAKMTAEADDAGRHPG